MAIFNAVNAEFNIRLDDAFAGNYWGFASQFANWTTVAATTTALVRYDLNSGQQISWEGSGLAYGSDLDGADVDAVSAGTLTSLTAVDSEGSVSYRMTGFAWQPTATTAVPVLASIFAGADTITGGLGDDLLSGYAGNDTLLGGSGDDALVGGAGADSLDGGAGNDIASYHDQTAAITIVLGATGGGTVTLASGNDTLANIEGIAGGGGADLVTGNALANQLIGNGGADTLTGGGGDDVMEGGLGLDRLDGGTGVDRVSFQTAGIAAVNFNMTTGLSNMLENDVSVTEYNTNFEAAIGSAGSDRISGTAANNSIDGGLGNDTLLGGLGADTLTGGAGKDVLNGEGGNDYYILSPDMTYSQFGQPIYTFDTITEANASATEVDTVELVYDGYYNGGPAPQYKLAANLENLVVNLEALPYSGTAVNAAGNNASNVMTVRQDPDGSMYSGPRVALAGYGGADTLIGGTGADTLDGGTGADRLTGGLGNDTYVVDSALDVVTENPYGGEDTIVSSVSVASLALNVENLRLTAISTALNGNGNGLNNSLYGNQFNNALSGGDGNDNLSGGDGNDSLAGGSGNDVLLGGLGDDSLDGGDNASTMYSGSGDTASYAGLSVGVRVNLSLGTVQATGAGSDTLINFESLAGGNGNDVLTGSATANNLSGNGGSDTILGLAGNDVLNGGAGADVLYGGSGSDSLFGGAGNDLFIFDTRETGSDYPGVQPYTDYVGDFTSGQDKLMLRMVAFQVGDRDTVIDGGVERSASGGFANSAELVVFSQNLPSYSLNTYNAAAAIGSATAAYASGDQRVFVLDDGYNTGIFLFRSSGADALVTQDELQLIGTVNNHAETHLADYMFIA